MPSIHLAVSGETVAPGAPVTVTRTGTFFDPRYGEFLITPAMLAEMVQNFDQKTFGQDIFIDVSHRPEDGAAGKFAALWTDGTSLHGDVEWTAYGRQAISERGYQYLSAEYADNWVDNERRQAHGATLLGAALTIRPVIKNLNPVRLSEATGVYEGLLTRLVEEQRHSSSLTRALSGMALPDPAKAALTNLFASLALNSSERGEVAESAQTVLRLAYGLSSEMDEDPTQRVTITLDRGPAQDEKPSLTRAEVTGLIEQAFAEEEEKERTQRLAQQAVERQKQEQRARQLAQQRAVRQADDDRRRALGWMD